MTKPALLMTGTYPSWDLDALAADYRVLKLWEAADPAAFLAGQGAEVRAIATRGDLGASSDLMRALPRLSRRLCSSFSDPASAHAIESHTRTVSRGGTAAASFTTSK